MASNDTYHGISKEEAIKKLNERGIPAVWDKGIVEIARTYNGTDHTTAEIQKVLKELDYRMSVGFNYRPEKTLAAEA